MAKKKYAAASAEFKSGPVRKGVWIEKYKDSRYWAVWVDGQLLAVTVYRKGAVAIREHLKEHEPWFR